MPSNAEKLLERARRKKAGWMPHDLLTLYQGFGFIIRDASGSHKFVSHPKYPRLTAVIPVHPKELGKKYIGLSPVFRSNNYSGGAVDRTIIVDAGMQPLTVVEHLDVVK
jgi:predicted RNA binding protein YcfA (HicA-like mRNA interferase family)